MPKARVPTAGGPLFGFISSRSLFPAAATVTLALVLVIISALALGCPPADTDRFGRLTTPYRRSQSFCLLPDYLNSVRNGFMIFIANALGLMAAGWLLGEACRAYSKLLPEGLSASYARTLTKQNGNLAALWWCLLNWKHEPGPRRLKLAVLSMMLLVPLLCGLLGIQAGVSYSGITVRVTTERLNTTSIPDWMTYENLTKAKWSADIALPVAGQRLATSNLMVAATDKETTFRGSGLPTVQTTIEEGYTTTLAYLGFDNVLVKPVPFGIKDLSIDQGLLLIEKSCMTDRSPSLFYVDTLRGFKEGLDFWLNLSRTLPEHNLPQREVSDSMLFADTYNYSTDGVIEKYEALVNTTAVTIRTISPDTSVACHTVLRPVRAVVDISANTTAPLLLTDYRRISFPPAVLQWVTTALDFTGKLISDIDSGKEPELPAELGLHLRGCSSTAVLAANGASAGTSNDSCVATEIDKIILGYLRALTGVPPVPLLVTDHITTAEEFLSPNYTAFENDKFPDFSNYTTKWAWGPVETRFVPRKVVSGSMIAVVVIILALFFVLHGLTALRGPLVVRDVAPWVVLADTADPPEALAGLGGVGVDQFIKEEQKRRLILSFDAGAVPVAGPSTASGPNAADNALLVYRVHSQGASTGQPAKSVNAV